MEDNKNLNQSSEDTMKHSSKQSSDENNIKATSIPNNRSNDTMSFMRHGVQIFKTAVPYLDYKSRRSINMIIQMTELANTVKELNDPDILSICEVGEETTNTEAMLVEIKNICSPKEQELIDVIINFMKAKSLYNTYRTLISSSSSSANRGNSNMFGFNENVNVFEMLTSFLPPEQKANFETMSMLFSTMNM